MVEEKKKQEPTANDAVTSSTSTEVGEVSVPYSIYTTKEKWMIVAMVALAGFYRYVSWLLSSTSFRSCKLLAVCIHVYLESRLLTEPG
jgi:hypothetical protein